MFLPSVQWAVRVTSEPDSVIVSRSVEEPRGSPDLRAADKSIKSRLSLFVYLSLFVSRRQQSERDTLSY